MISKTAKDCKARPSPNTGQTRGDCNVEIVQGAGPCGRRPRADPSAGLQRRPRSPMKAFPPTEIVIGTHQDLSGPIKVWGVPVSNGMKMAVEEINAAGGINGRKLRMILEDNGYDPKKAVLATQKMVEHDKVFAMVGADGLGAGAGRAGHPVRCRRAAAVPADRGRIHLQVRSGEAAGAAEVQQPAALCREHPRRAQIHDGGKELQEALPDAPGRRVRQERARRLHRAA